MIPVLGYENAGEAVTGLFENIDLPTILPLILVPAAIVFAILLGKRIFSKLAK